MSADTFRKLVALGLTTDQIAGVLEIMDQSAEQRKAKARERVQRWREKKRDETQRNVTERNETQHDGSRTGDARGLDNLQTKNQAGQKKQNSLGSSADADEPFERFWRVYPRREGPNPKKPAKLQFVRLVAKGADPERIIAAARLFADENPTPTRFIAQAQTWLSQERFDEQVAVRTGNEFCPDDWPNTRFLLIRWRQEYPGVDPPPAVQGGKAGYMLPAEWVANSREQTRSAHA